MNCVLLGAFLSQINMSLDPGIKAYLNGLINYHRNNRLSFKKKDYDHLRLFCPLPPFSIMKNLCIELLPYNKIVELSNDSELLNIVLGLFLRKNYGCSPIISTEYHLDEEEIWVQKCNFTEATIFVIGGISADVDAKCKLVWVG